MLHFLDWEFFDLSETECLIFDIYRFYSRRAVLPIGPLNALFFSRKSIWNSRLCTGLAGVFPGRGRVFFFCCHSCEISGSLGKRFPFLFSRLAASRPLFSPFLLSRIFSLFVFFYTVGKSGTRARGEYEIPGSWPRASFMPPGALSFFFFKLYFHVKWPAEWIRRSMNSVLRRRIINSRFPSTGEGLLVLTRHLSREIFRVYERKGDANALSGRNSFEKRRDQTVVNRWDVLRFHGSRNENREMFLLRRTRDYKRISSGCQSANTATTCTAICERVFETNTFAHRRGVERGEGSRTAVLLVNEIEVECNRVNFKPALMSTLPDRATTRRVATRLPRRPFLANGTYAILINRPKTNVGADGLRLFSVWMVTGVIN